MKLKIDIHNMRGFSEKQKQKYLDACDFMTLAFNSQQFKTWCLDFPFQQTNGKTNEQIYNMIMSGKDQYGDADSDIDIDVTLYFKRWSRVIGYTYGNTMRTWINLKYFRSFGIADLCGNISHEYLHNVGFGHNPINRNTVPYAVGDEISHLVDLYLQGKETLIPVKEESSDEHRKTELQVAAIKCLNELQDMNAKFNINVVKEYAEAMLKDMN